MTNPVDPETPNHNDGGTDFLEIVKQRDELATLVEDLLSQGNFFITAIEAKDGWTSDFEELERRAKEIITRVRSK